MLDKPGGRVVLALLPTQTGAEGRRVAKCISSATVVVTSGHRPTALEQLRSTCAGEPSDHTALIPGVRLSVGNASIPIRIVIVIVCFFADDDSAPRVAHRSPRQASTRTSVASQAFAIEAEATRSAAAHFRQLPGQMDRVISAFSLQISFVRRGGHQTQSLFADSAHAAYSAP